MGIHYSQHTEEFKLAVVKKYKDEGYTSPTKLAKLVGVSESSIRCWLRKYNDCDDLVSAANPGLVKLRERQTTIRESEIIINPTQEFRMSWRDVEFMFPTNMDVAAIAKLSILLSERNL